MKRLGRVLTVAVAVTMMAFSGAQAAPILDFGTGLAGSGGTITINGSNVVGENIKIGALTVIGSQNPVNPDDVYVVTEGLLNFNTANDVITIDGNIAKIGVGGRLMTGQFDGWLWTGAPVNQFEGWGTDEKDSALLRAFGLSNIQEWRFFGWTLGTPADKTGEKFTAFSTDFKNQPVPEPSTMLLLGAGLLGLGLIRRKKQVR